MAVAILFDGEQICDLTEAQAKAYSGKGFLWQHSIIISDGDLHEVPNLPDVARSALLAAETRPRCDQIEDGALLNLRGPALDPGQSNET